MFPAAMEHVTYGYTGSQVAEGANTSMDKVRRCGDAVRAIVLWLKQVNHSLALHRDTIHVRQGTHPDDKLTPSARERVRALEEAAQGEREWSYVDEDALVVEVAGVGGGEGHTVDLLGYNCTCGVPQTDLFPCVHFAFAVAVAGPDPALPARAPTGITVRTIHICCSINPYAVP